MRFMSDLAGSVPSFGLDIPTILAVLPAGSLSKPMKAYVA
jgi:hypothetical protein